MSRGKRAGSNADRMAGAMRAFLENGDAAAFEQNVVEFVHTARDREVPVERVVGDLEALADGIERNRLDGTVILERTELRRLLLRGVLVAFYGAEPVARGESLERERRARIDNPGSAP